MDKPDYEPAGSFTRSFIVSLESFEIDLARYVGQRRHESAVTLGLRDRYHDPDKGLTCHENGAIAELAVAKRLDRYWPASVNTFNTGADVSSWIQVRWSRYPNAHLILHATDDNHQAFVLVTGTLPTLTLRGWIFGAYGKVNGTQRPNGDVWVKQADLQPMEVLLAGPR